MPSPRSNTSRYSTKTTGTEAGEEEVEDFLPTEIVFIVATLSSRSPKIPTRARLHRVHPCILYSNRGAQRTSGREMIGASDNL